MPRTFNRAPITVNTPSSSDVKQYFFNHSNWKGITDNKNLLQVDQETFSDAKNVYVDEEGLLKSRPALVFEEGDISKIWTFSNLKAVLKADNSLQISYDKNTYVLNDVAVDIKPILYANRLLLFSSTSLNAFNLLTKSFETTKDIVYIPKTKVFAKDDDSEIINKNELSESEVYVYLYELIDGEVSINSKVYNNVVYLLDNDGNKWNFIFDDISRIGITNEHALTDLEISNEDLNNINIQYSDIGTAVLSIFAYNNRSIYYSIDGNKFNQLQLNSLVEYETTKYGRFGGLLDVTISHDGYHVGVLTAHNAYIKSVVNDGVNFYLDWTPLLQDFRPCQYRYSEGIVTVALHPDANTAFHDEDVLRLYDATTFAIAQTSYSITNIDGRSFDAPMSYLLYVTADKQRSFVINSFIGGITEPGDALFTNKDWKNTILLDVNDKLCVGILSSRNLLNELFFSEFVVDIGLLYSESYRKRTGYTNFNNFCKVQSDTSYFLYSKADTALTSSARINRFSIVDGLISSNLRDNNYKYLILAENFLSYTDKYYIDNTSLTSYNYNFDKTYDRAFPMGKFMLFAKQQDGKIVFETNKLSKPVEIYEDINFENDEPKFKYLLPDTYEINDSLYLSVGNNLFISHSSEDGKLYFPEIQTQTFTNDITGLHTISSTETAIFFDDSVQNLVYDANTTVENLQGVYRYYKTKLPLGKKLGNDILTTFDGKYSLFVTSRGLAAMSYQNFVASEDQTLEYLTDTIYNRFIQYISQQSLDNAVKLFKYAFWIFVYKPDSNVLYLLDIRNSSWWIFEFFDNVKQIVVVDNKLRLLLNNELYSFKAATELYSETEFKTKTTHKIDWFIKSQRLHLNAVNYYKHIVNMTFVFVRDVSNLQNSEYNINETDFKLQVNNYRKRIDGNINSDDFVSVTYDIESVRTFVQRLNYSKVNEFEYMLSSDNSNAIDIPLSVNSITIKYRVGSQVR